MAARWRLPARARLLDKSAWRAALLARLRQAALVLRVHLQLAAPQAGRWQLEAAAAQQPALRVQAAHLQLAAARAATARARRAHRQLAAARCP